MYTILLDRETGDLGLHAIDYLRVSAKFGRMRLTPTAVHTQENTLQAHPDTSGVGQEVQPKDAPNCHRLYNEQDTWRTNPDTGSSPFPTRFCPLQFIWHISLDAPIAPHSPHSPSRYPKAQTHRGLWEPPRYAPPGMGMSFCPTRCRIDTKARIIFLGLVEHTYSRGRQTEIYQDCNVRRTFVIGSDTRVRASDISQTRAIARCVRNDDMGHCALARA